MLKGPAELAANYSFQSTPPHEGRCRKIVQAAMDVRFQSTPPHEGRSRPSLPAILLALFQSTPPHEGRFLAVAAGDEPRSVSIHAPA